MIPADQIKRARETRLEHELARRGVQLKRQGGELVGGCPRCAGHDRFGVNLRKQLWNCRHCSQGGNAISLVQFLDGCDFRTAVETLAGRAASVPKVAHASHLSPSAQRDGDYERRQHEKAAWLWSQRQSIAGTIAEAYLRNRGYHGALPATLGFLPAYREHPPAMLSAFALPVEYEPCTLGPPTSITAVHITALRADGSDRLRQDGAKKIIGSPGGLPIAVSAINDLLGLAATEGVEDALALFEATGLGCWAAGSAPMMPALAQRVPSYVECCTIEMHPDGGRPSALALADALEKRGIEIFLREAV